MLEVPLPTSEVPFFQLKAASFRQKCQGFYLKDAKHHFLLQNDKIFVSTAHVRHPLPHLKDARLSVLGSTLHV